MEFLPKPARATFSRQVKLQIRSFQFSRRHWIEVLGKEEGMAEVEAKIGKDNTIKLKSGNVGRLLRREVLPGQGLVRVLVNGREDFNRPLAQDCLWLPRSWREAADPFLAYSAELAFDVLK